MTTAAQAPGTSAAVRSLDPDAVAALITLKAACQGCEDADNQQARRGADRASATYDSVCHDDARNRFLALGKAKIDDMWAKFHALQDGYQTSLRPHENVGPRLHRTYTDTWAAVAMSLAPITADVQARRAQDHWVGAGAGDYMKQLPVQLSALNELTQYVAVAGAGVETPALLQQGVFAAFIATAGHAAQQIQGYAGTETGEHYFQRSAWAANTLGQCLDWFTRTLLTGNGSWRPVLEAHIQQMTSSAVTKATVLTGDSWPKATKDTDASTLPAGTEPKYASPSGVGTVGTTTPVTDRGSSSGVSVDDAAGPTTMAPGPATGYGTTATGSPSTSDA